MKAIIIQGRSEEKFTSQQAEKEEKERLQQE